MIINTKKILTLNPCQSKLNNYLKYYKNFSGSVSEFFNLNKLTHEDKLWVVLKLIDADMCTIFALDCAFSAAANSAAYAANAAYYASSAAYYAAYHAAYYAVDAAYHAANAAYAAYYAADAANAADAAYRATGGADYEKSRQLDALVYLIEGINKLK